MNQLIAQVSKRKKFNLKSQGVSMLPTIHPNDVVYLQKINFSQIKINDIVLAQKNQKYFIHRVIYQTPPPRGSPFGHPRGVSNAYLITKGDNASKSDGKIYAKQLVAKVYQVRRNGQVFNPHDINLLQSTFYFAEIVKINKLLSKNKIDFVFLKGLPLHLFIEKSHPKRFYADCDILVDPNDYDKLEKVLSDMKYKKANSAFSPTFAKLKDKPTEVSFYKKVNNFPIVFDVHFEPVFLMNQLGSLESLYPQSLLNQMTEQFLGEKRIVKIQNEYFPILSSSNLIIYLALHFFHHNYRGIYRLELLDKVIRNSPRIRGRYDLVWRKVQDDIKLFKLQNFVYPTFLLLQKFFNTPASKEFLDTIKPDHNKLNNIKNNILNVDVFSDQSRTVAGIERFKNIFYLSPFPIFRKIIVFATPAVIYSLIWILYRRLKRPHL